MTAPPPETASQSAGAVAGQQLPPADRAARAPRRPHFANAHSDGLDKEIVRRWLLSTMRTNTPPLKTGARCARRGGFAAAAEHLLGSPRHRRPGAVRAGRYRPCYHYEPDLTVP